MAPHRNHVEMRAKKIAARQYVSETHDHKSDAPRRQYYTASEVARDFCHVTPDAFYRSREERHSRDGLPRPYQLHPMLFERTGMDAWRGKNDPRRPGLPANDIVPEPEPISDEEKLARLHKYYRTAPAG